MIESNLPELISVHLSITDSVNVFEYLNRAGIKKEADAILEICKLIEIGITVMNTVQVNQDIQFVKNEVEKLTIVMAKNINDFENTLQKSVDDVLNTSLNIDVEDSLMAKTKKFMREQLEQFQKEMNVIKNDAKETAKLIIENAKTVSGDRLVLVEKGITDANANFNPDLTTSYLGKMKSTIEDTKKDISKHLDFSSVDSFAFKLNDEAKKFFGADSPVLGAIQTIITTQQDNIIASLNLLREEIARKEGNAEMLNKTAVKGFIFEDDMEEMLAEYAKSFGDIVTRTSLETKSGRADKKGDFIYEFPNDGNKLVIEAKDEAIGLKPMLAYMKEAMELRECDFGILCTKTLEQLPKQVGMFNLYEGNKLFCSFDFLPIAIKWSRLYMERIKLVQETDGVDVTLLKDKIEVIKNSMKSFAAVKTRLTNIDKTVTTTTEEIRGLLDTIKEDVTTSLDALE